MTRAFTPPDTLSQDDIRTIADVRRAIWTEAFQGLLIGTVAGFGLHTAAKFGQNRGYWKMAFLNRNTALFSVLLGGAIGSFANALATGKNQVHNLHPIFEVGAKPPLLTEDGKVASPYQHKLEEMRQREIELQILEARRDRTATEQEYVEKARREKNRLYRRASLSQALQDGHHGLSDSHGGHWVNPNDEHEDEEETGNL
jgi:hypothetical protein